MTSGQSDRRMERIELVVIGASAGGVEALGLLLQHLPAACRVAVAVVLHLPPDRNSLLPSLYAQRCQAHVKEVEDKEAVSSGTVYFAPPDYHMQLEPDRSFSLSVDGAVNFSRPSIDVTMESAAYAYGERMLGIVLTGASADGAAGLAVVRQQGGLAWVQDPDQAAVRTMPEAALALAGADRVLTLEQMGEELMRLGPLPGATPA
jgi:two-component system chemotaxis response regulator CheB